MFYFVNLIFTVSSVHSCCTCLYQFKNQDPVLPIKTEVFATTICCYLFIAGAPTTIKYLFPEITVDHLVIITAAKERKKRQLCSIEYIINNLLHVPSLLSQLHLHNNLFCSSNIGGHWLLQESDLQECHPNLTDHQKVYLELLLLSRPGGAGEVKIRATWGSKGKTWEMGLKD